MIVKSIGTQWKYSWTDEYGYHEYYCGKVIGEDVGKMENIDFQRKKMDNLIKYSWIDKLGYHEYYCEL
jgi:hypothetical protein